MDKDYIRGLKQGLGFLTVIFLGLGIVFAVGFHSANEVLSGTFQGNYVVNGTFNAPNIDRNILANTFRSSFSNSLEYQSLENGFLDTFSNLNYVNSSASENIFLDSNSINNYPTNNVNFSASGWSGNTGSFSWTGNSVSGSNANIAIINSKNFSLGTNITFDATPAHGCFFIIDATERGSFSAGNDYCGTVDTTFTNYVAISLYISSMNSGPHYIEKGEDYVSASVTSAYTSGDRISLVVDSSGTAKVYQNGVLDHTFSHTFTGPFAVALSNGNNNGGASWNNFEYVEQGDATNSSLVSNNIEISGNYSNFLISIFEEDLGTPITINSDLKGYIIDNSSNNYEVTLEDKGNITSSIKLYQGNIRLNQSTNVIKYNISSLNSKPIKYHGLGIIWS